MPTTKIRTGKAHWRRRWATRQKYKWNENKITKKYQVVGGTARIIAANGAARLCCIPCRRWWWCARLACVFTFSLNTIFYASASAAAALPLFFSFSSSFHNATHVALRCKHRYPLYRRFINYDRIIMELSGGGVICVCETRSRTGTHLTAAPARAQKSESKSIA